MNYALSFLFCVKPCHMTPETSHPNQQKDIIPEKRNENIITDHYINDRQEKLKAIEKKIKKSRNTLFFVAALTLIAGLLLLKTKGYNDGREFKYTVFISLVFVALGFFTKKEPFAALVMALIIYVGL